MFNMGGRKRARAAEVGGAAEGEGVTDLSERTAMQFVMAALGSIERLGEAHGATAHGGALLDRAAQSVITSELVRCLGRAMVDRHPTSTPVSLSDIFDVSEFAVRILVSLPLRNRLACALVCTTWRSRVQHDCEDEDRYDSKTLRCTLLSRTKAPVIQLGLFSRGSKTFVLALSKACELTKLLCTTAPDASQQQQQQHEWNVPMVSHEAMAAWSRFWPSSGSAGAPAAEPPAGERASDQLPPDKALLHEPFDSQVVVNNAGSYLMLLQQGMVRLFYALFHRDWTPEQISLSFAMPPRVTALQFFPLDNNVFAIAHAAAGAEGEGEKHAVHTLQVLTVRGAVIQTLRGFHQQPIEGIWYYKGANGSFTFQVTHSADVIHWWRLSHNPQWPGMVHSTPARSLPLPPLASPAVAVRLHPSGDAVVVASREQLRVHSFNRTVPDARRAMRVVTAATLLCVERDGILLVAGSTTSVRSDQILFFSCAGLALLRKCTLPNGCGAFVAGQPRPIITAIGPPEVPETRTMKKRQTDAIHELAVGNDRGETILLAYRI